MKKKRISELLKCALWFVVMVCICALMPACSPAKAAEQTAQVEPAASKAAPTQTVSLPTEIKFDPGFDIKVTVEVPKRYSDRAKEALRLEAIANSLEAEAKRLEQLGTACVAQMRQLAKRAEEICREYLRSLNRKEYSDYSEYRQIMTR